jgi:prefoldin subunit 5
MTAVMRYLFVLLLGVLLGAGGAVYAIQSDAGNLLVQRTEVVQDLQRRLHEMEEQRNQLARQLDDVASRAGRMEQAFAELERRFHSMQEDRPPAPPPASPPPAQTP